MATLHSSHIDTQKGFSLIELLVSVALFAVVMVVSVGTLLALVDANQKAQSLKTVMNNLNFALDSMTRTIRTGREFYCMNNPAGGGALPDGVQDCVGGDQRLVVTDDQGDRVAYQHGPVSKAIERKVNNGPWVPLTAPDVVIEEFRFYVTGPLSGAYGTADTVQPMVTMSVRGRAGNDTATESTFNVQTTVTQWLLDE